jgi:hypothetical protein
LSHAAGTDEGEPWHCVEPVDTLGLCATHRMQLAPIRQRPDKAIVETIRLTPPECASYWSHEQSRSRNRARRARALGYEATGVGGQIDDQAEEDRAASGRGGTGPSASRWSRWRWHSAWTAGSCSTSWA